MSSSRSQSLLFTLGGAVLGLVALTGGYLLTSSGEDRTAADDPASTEDRDTDRSSPSAEPTAAPSPDPATDSPEPSSEPSVAQTGTVTVPAYFVVDTEDAGPRLVREFRRVPSDAPLAHALALVTDGVALDPDYRTLWPGGGFASVSYDEQAGVVTVELADDGWTTPAAGMDATAAERALQQVVYTAQGVVQARPRVEFVVGGAPATVFGVDSTGGLTQASPLAVLNLVSLTTPEQGAPVEDGTLEISGVGSSFEAGIGWEVRDASGAVVRSGGTTALGWMGDRLFPFETTVRLRGLAPGDYEVFVTTDDPTGGTEGIAAQTDTKAFTIG